MPLRSGERTSVGGKPSKGTSADQRLKRNNPGAGNVVKKNQPFGGKQAPPFTGKTQRKGAK